MQSCCTNRGVFSGIYGAISMKDKIIHGSLYVLVDPVIRQKPTVGENSSVDDDCDLLDESEPEKPCEVEKHQDKCKETMVLGLTCKKLEEIAAVSYALPSVALGTLVEAGRPWMKVGLYI